MTYIRNFLKKILQLWLSYIYYSENQKSRIRKFKNFLIYLTNYFYLINITNKINLLFEKFAKKVEVLL